MKWLLLVSALVASLSIAGVVITYLILRLPQGIIVANWGMGAIVLAWIATAVAIFFAVLSED